MGRRVGRPPVLPVGEVAVVSLRVPGWVKVLLVEQAEAFGLSLSEYVASLVVRDAAGSEEG